MTTDAGAPRSRRALLTAGLAAGIATVANALGKPRGAAAANTQAIQLGVEPSSFNGTGTNEATLTTAIYTTAGNGFGARTSSPVGTGLLGHASALTGSTIGVRGLVASVDGTAVRGESTGTSGLNYGGWFTATSSNSSIGVKAEGTVTGVSATATGQSGAYGVFGVASSGTGTSVGVGGTAFSGYGFGVSGLVTGTVGPGAGVHGRSAADAGIGVEGIASSEAGLVWGGSFRAASPSGIGAQGHGAGGGIGILGTSGPGGWVERTDTGVYGEAHTSATSRGVHGYSPAGRGVFGQATTGSGLYGSASTGYALRTSGRIRFEKVSGIATIAVSTSAIVVVPGGTAHAVDLASSSKVLLTPRGNLGGRSLWYTVDATADTFTIHVSNAVTSALSVSWLVIS